MTNNWPHQSQCLKLFGNPTNKGFAKKNLTWVTPPFKLYMGDILIKRFQMNKVCAESLSRVLNSVWEQCDKDQAKIHAQNIDKWSGAWAVRNMRGGSHFSMHAYGLAIDFNAPDNPLGAVPGHHPHSFTEDHMLVKAFDKEGWVWGGRWHGRPDGMHWQAAIV